jgi:hypothetical protein
MNNFLIYFVINAVDMVNQDLDGTEVMETHMDITRECNQVLEAMDQDILWFSIW